MERMTYLVNLWKIIPMLPVVPFHRAFPALAIPWTLGTWTYPEGDVNREYKGKMRRAIRVRWLCLLDFIFRGFLNVEDPDRDLPEVEPDEDDDFEVAEGDTKWDPSVNDDALTLIEFGELGTWVSHFRKFSPGSCELEKTLGQHQMVCMLPEL